MAETEHHSHLHSKTELRTVLRHIGVAPETITEIESKLPADNWFDCYEAGGLLQSYGLTLDEAISRIGGSP
jgi:hypothetical protein